MRFRRTKRGLGLSLAGTLLLAALPASCSKSPKAEAPSDPQSEVFEQLLEVAVKRGTVRVMIELDVPELTLDPSNPQSWASELDQFQSILPASQNQVLAQLGPTFDPKRAVMYQTLPNVAAELTYVQLVSLQGAVDRNELPFEIKVGPDLPLRSHTASGPPTPAVLESSLITIGAKDAFDRGAYGSGWLVAVIDDGVAPYDFLEGKVTDGARYTSDEPFFDELGVEVKKASGNAAYGEPEEPDESGSKSHGTKIASVICGNQDGSVPPGDGMLTGVAPGAQLLAIRVADSSGQTLTSDVILALEDLFLDNLIPFLNGTPQLAAVNISLGAGLYANELECLETVPGKAFWEKCALLGVIDVPVVASAGNDEEEGLLAFPAILSTVVAVGATDDLGQALSSSNWSDRLSLGAPGLHIYGVWNSEIGGKDYLSSGTSAATPHVSGSIALLRSLYPDRTCMEIVEALLSVSKVTGGTSEKVPVTRLHVGEAIKVLELSP